MCCLRVLTTVSLSRLAFEKSSPLSCCSSLLLPVCMCDAGYCCSCLLSACSLARPPVSPRSAPACPALSHRSLLTVPYGGLDPSSILAVAALLPPCLMHCASRRMRKFSPLTCHHTSPPAIPSDRTCAPTASFPLFPVLKFHGSALYHFPTNQIVLRFVSHQSSLVFPILHSEERENKKEEEAMPMSKGCTLRQFAPRSDNKDSRRNDFF